jgi:hypothetical protein
MRHDLLVVALKRCWLVAAAGLAFLRTVVFAIFVWHLLVEWVTAGDLSALLFELNLGCVSGRHDLFILFQGLCGARKGGGILGIVSNHVRYRRENHTKQLTLSPKA